MPKHDITTQISFLRPVVCQTDTCKLYQKNYNLICDALCNVHCELEDYFEPDDDQDIDELSPCQGCDCDGNLGPVHPFLLDSNTSNNKYFVAIRFTAQMVETCINLIKNVQEDKTNCKQVILATDAAFGFADDFVAHPRGNYVGGDYETGYEILMQNNHDERNKVVEVDDNGVRFCIDITSKTESQGDATQLQSATYSITDLLKILDKVQTYILRTSDTVEHNEDTQE